MTQTSRHGSEVLEFSDLEVRQQPDDVTCGPTCLQALYAFHGIDLRLDDVIASVRSLDHGGTLGVLLGIDALERGFDATLYSYNLQVLDPSWFSGSPRDLKAELERQLEIREGKRLRAAIQAYVDFLDQGGEIRHEELTPQLLAEIVRGGSPPITGLSATYLYGCQREVFDGKRSRYDDVNGEPVGHFVVVSGVDPSTGDFRISDPSQDNPLHGSGTYWVSPYRLLGAIFLGVTTYDGNLLVVRRGEA
ncbi:MAG: hypothetical protein R3253_03635 [Longimicrobiales bacterium]|nr:hypothetical protein [Longimicrobiales bacterium]